MSPAGPPRGLPRLLARIPTDGSAMPLADHQRTHGPLPERTPAELVEEIERSGLRGRGGADFPAAVKLRSIIARRARPVIVVNGSETEPASGKDRLLLSRLPHLVLDGAALVASATGAEEVVVRLPESERASTAAVAAAVALRTAVGAPLRVATGPDGFVTGEESAVVRELNGGPTAPTFTPPRVFERGVGGRPTLVHNPETLAQIALIARHGSRWYREVGTDADPGSVLVTVSGAVARPGVLELAFGTPLADVLAAAGGPTERLQAVLLGGFFGTWMRAARIAGLRLARQDLQEAGASLGAGVIVALGERASGLAESARILDVLARGSAGQCGPCVHGLRALADQMAGLAELGPGTSPGHVHEVTRLAGLVEHRGACHHPDGAARLARSAVTVFAGSGMA